MPRRQDQQEDGRPAAAPGEQKRVTPVDIQQKEFRLAFRGYHEGEVDQFLDELTEEVARLYAENKRLREELDFKRTERLDTQATGEADAILRQAREAAARIVEEARARASTAGAAGSEPLTLQAGTALLGPFLAREREFLQGLASLIQRHADAVKEGITRARQEMVVARPEPPTPAPAPVETEASSGEADTVVESAEATGEDPDEVPGDSEGMGAPAEPKSEQIMDLTDEAVEVEKPARQPVAADDRDDRSLREFFWGED
jgi:DivIVA domain-containing protein